MITEFVTLILAILSIVAYGIILIVVIVMGKRRLDRLLGRITIHKTEEAFKICISGLSEANLTALYNEIAIACVKYTDQLKVKFEKYNG